MVIVRQRPKSARKHHRAGSVNIGVSLVAVPHLQELCGRWIGAYFRRQQVVLERRRNGSPIEVGIDPAGVDDVARGPLQPLTCGEEVRAVFDDWTADRGAILIAPVR